MRRPVTYIAGLLLATGASLALAAPASAHGHGDDYDLDYRSSSYDLDYRYSDNFDEYNQFSLINVLSPNGQGNTGLGILGLR